MITCARANRGRDLSEVPDRVLNGVARGASAAEAGWARQEGAHEGNRRQFRSLRVRDGGVDDLLVGGKEGHERVDPCGRRCREFEQRDVDVRVGLVTSEPSPLALFGTRASATVRSLLEDRGIEVWCSKYPAEFTEGRLSSMPDWSIEADFVVAGPRLAGQASVLREGSRDRLRLRERVALGVVPLSEELALSRCLLFSAVAASGAAGEAEAARRPSPPRPTQAPRSQVRPARTATTTLRPCSR